MLTQELFLRCLHMITHAVINGIIDLFEQFLHTGSGNGNVVFFFLRLFALVIFQFLLFFVPYNRRKSS